MICIPIVSSTHQGALRDILRSGWFADCLELRMDLIGDGRLAELISAVKRHPASPKVIVTCRSKEEAAPVGNRRVKCSGKTGKDKKALLKEAIELGADFIDVELSEGKKTIEELQSWRSREGKKTGLIVSYHNLEMTPSFEALRTVFLRCVALKPDVVKIVTMARAFEDNWKVLNLVVSARHFSQKLIAFCMGEKGVISRVVSPLVGGFLNFAVLDESKRSAPGQLTVRTLKHLEGWLKSPCRLGGAIPQPKNFVLLGNPVAHSLSPFMHNRALRDLGVEESYMACCVEDIAQAVEGLRGMNLHGASVTLPFKVAVIPYLDDIDEDALNIGAVNTILQTSEGLKGFNTDWKGITQTLKKRISIKNKTFAVLGAGGTARAAIYGILKEGGFPLVINRTRTRGRKLAREFGCPFYTLSEIGHVEADCLINTTSVGMYPQIHQSPVPVAVLKNFPYVMDVIYNPCQTKLLRDAVRQGCRILSGIDVFVYQGAEQIKIWTGKEPPVALMRKMILKRLTSVS